MIIQLLLTRRAEVAHPYWTPVYITFKQYIMKGKAMVEEVYYS